MMSGYSRQDDLLSKLKSCVGSLGGNTNESYKSQDMVSTPTANYANRFNHRVAAKKQFQPKENVQHRTTLNSGYEYQPNISMSGRNDYSQKQSFNNSRVPDRKCVLQQRKYDNSQNSKGYERQAKTKYQFGSEKIDYSALKSNNRANNIDFTQQLRNRYSSGGITERGAVRNMQQRNEIAEKGQLQSHQKNQSDPKASDYENYSSLTARKMRDQSRSTGITARLEEYSQNNKVQSAMRSYSSLSKEPISSLRSRQLDYTRPAAREESSQKKQECSALEKLRRISELNSKINDRIRNIITVFEEHKC